MRQNCRGHRNNQDDMAGFPYKENAKLNQQNSIKSKQLVIKEIPKTYMILL